MPYEVDEQLMNTNVLGSYYTFVAFMRLLEAGNTHPDSRGKKDSIKSQYISVSSLASFSRKELVSYTYGASKAALTHMTKMLATGFASMDIRANTIAPGLYITEMTSEVRCILLISSLLVYADTFVGIFRC